MLNGTLAGSARPVYRTPYADGWMQLGDYYAELKLDDEATEAYESAGRLNENVAEMGNEGCPGVRALWASERRRSATARRGPPRSVPGQLARLGRGETPLEQVSLAPCHTRLARFPRGVR